MKLWVDDVRPAPDGEWVVCKSVDRTKWMIEYCELICSDLNLNNENDKLTYDVYAIEIISLDHDAGDYARDGGDYIKLLDWLEETGRNYPIRIHSMNPVGVENMRRIIKRNGWKEVY